MKSLFFLVAFSCSFMYAQQIQSNKKGKFGVAQDYLSKGDSYDDAQIPFIYENIRLIDSNFICSKKIIAIDGSTYSYSEVDVYNKTYELTNQFDEIHFFEMNYSEKSACTKTIVLKDSKYSFLEVNNDAFKSFGSFDKLTPLNNPIKDQSGCLKLEFSFSQNGKIGVTDTKAKIIVDALAAESVSFMPVLNMYEFKLGAISSIYSSENKLIATDIINIERCCNNEQPHAILTKSNGKKSIIIENEYYDINADNIIQCLYAERVIVMNGGKYSLYNSKMDPVSDETFEDILPLDQSGCTAAKKNGKYIFINSDAQRIGELEADVVNHIGYLFYTFQKTGVEKIYVTKSPEFISANDQPFDVVYLSEYETILYAQQEAKWGYIAKDQPTFNFEFSFITDEIEHYYEGNLLLATYMTGEKVVIDEEGMIYFKDLQLESISGLDGNQDDALLILKKDNKVACVYSYGCSELDTIHFIYDEIISDEDIYEWFYGVLVKKDGRCGIAEITGNQIKEIIPPLYDEIILKDYYLIDMGYLMTRNGEHYGLHQIPGYYIDSSVAKIIEPVYDKVYAKNDLVYLKKGKLYGIMDVYQSFSYLPIDVFLEPAFVKEPQSDFLYYGMPFIKLFMNGKYSWVAATEVELIYFDSYIQPNKKTETYIIQKGDKFGMIDFYSGLMVPTIYEQVIPIPELEYVLVKTTDSWGLVALGIDTIIRIANNWSNQLNHQLGFDTTTFSSTVPQIETAYFYNELIVTKNNDLYGGFQYFGEGSPLYFPAVFKEEPSGFIYYESRMEEIEINGVQKFICRTDTSFIVIDEIIQPDKNNETYITRVGTKYGAIDNQYGGIFAPAYDEVIPLYDERFIVRIGNKWGMVNLMGQEMLPLEYNSKEEVIEIAQE